MVVLLGPEGVGEGLLGLGLGLLDGSAGHAPAAVHVAEGQLAGTAVVALDGPDQPPFGGDHGIDVVAGVEPHIVHGEDVGGIRHGHGQDVAGPLQGQDLVLVGQFRGHQGDDRGLDGRPLVQVGGGDAVLHAQEADDVLVGAEAQAHHEAAQFPALPALQLDGLIQLNF